MFQKTFNHVPSSDCKQWMHIPEDITAVISQPMKRWYSKDADGQTFGLIYPS